jgi:hypothetical protein
MCRINCHVCELIKGIVLSEIHQYSRIRCLINKGLKIMASGAGGRKRMFIPPKDEIGLDMEQQGTPSTPDGKKKVKKVSKHTYFVIFRTM